MQLSTARRELEVKAAAVLELRRRKASRQTVYAMVSPEKGHLSNITRQDGEWIETDADPTVYMAEKLGRVLKSQKRFIVLIGGRGSSKSVAIADLCIADAKDTGNKTYFLREFQSSIKNSVISLIKDQIRMHNFNGFDLKENAIGRNGEQCFEFAGLARNIESVKSTHGFKRFAVEEAQFISQASLDALTPTIRKKPKAGLPSKFTTDIIGDIEENPDLDSVSIIFIANPGSSADPFSQRFIEPFKDKMVNGVYEDDLHLIVEMNYYDNPWYEDSGLEGERQWDYANRSRAYYDHRWNGAYNDSVEGSIIKPEWFDAAVNAHKLDRLKTAFEPRGAKIAAHDPFNDGNDAGGYALRHGSIIRQVRKKTSGEIDTVCDWATGLARKDGVDWFVWDADGMGTGLKRQAFLAFNGTKTDWHMFYGSLAGSAQDDADLIYMPQEGEKNARPYSDTFRNNRAQYYTKLADRFYNTYKCVERGEYIDPDNMISLDSEGIEDIQGLRSELCRIPTVPNANGLIQIMSKIEMKKNKIKSPNMGDSVMMTLFSPKIKKKFKPLDYPEMSIV